MNLVRAIEMACQAEIGPRVRVSVGEVPGAQVLTLETDDGFVWDNFHADEDPPDLPWVVIRRFTRAYRGWFDHQAELFLQEARDRISD